MIPDELYIETEMHDISILYYVFFSFNTQFSGFFDSSLRAILKEVFVFDNFGTDKTFLKVGMDHSGTLWSFPSFFVYSLSGGESFLISLALALGLSSLSSNNLKVESLFIDEGFGSLDADSLRTAMEALRHQHKRYR